MALRSIYSAASEFLALTVRDLLRENGIGAMLKSYEIVGFNLGMHQSGGMWGEVLVEEEDLNRAQELIGAFRGTLGELAEAEPVDKPEAEED
jgi:hypothetical protein